MWEEYNAMIRGLVPKERLLEYHIREGWEPLCMWLGKDIPKKEMPNWNVGGDFEMEGRGFRLSGREKL